MFFIPIKVIRLKTLVSTTGYSNTSETDIGGLINPFLQVKLLQAILELLKVSFFHKNIIIIKSNNNKS
jgi:hypothetical protein